MASRLALQNQALARLGTRSVITSETESSPEALAARQFFDQARDATLSAFEWRFATAFVAGAQIAGTAPQPWLYQYARPSDCVRLRRVMGPPQPPPSGLPATTPPYPGAVLVTAAPWCWWPEDGAGPWEWPWCGGPQGWRAPSPQPLPLAFEEGAAMGNGGFLPAVLTNVTPATLVYTTNGVDPAYWPPLFAAAFSWQLAFEMTVSLTGKLALQKQMQEGWAQAMQAARSVDRNAAVTSADYPPDWILARGP